MAQHSDLPALVDRPTAAKLCGLKESTLRKWWSATPPRGPRGVKLSTARSGRVLYPTSELLAWSRDPLRYEETARPSSVPTYDPPQRRGDRRGVEPSS